jgi:hypothetical protein
MERGPDVNPSPVQNNPGVAATHNRSQNLRLPPGLRIILDEITGRLDRLETLPCVLACSPSSCRCRTEGRDAAEAAR